MITFPFTLASALAEVEFVGFSSGQIANAQQLVISSPSGVAEGDTMVLFTASNDSGTTNPTVSGWTVRQGTDIAQTAVDMWSRTAGASEGNITIDSGSPTSEIQAIAVAFRNVSTPTYTSPATSSSSAVATETTNNWADDSGIAVVGWHANRDNTNNVDISTPPTDMTEIAVVDGSGMSRSDLILSAYYLTMADRGSINRSQNYNVSDVAHVSLGAELR